MTDRRSKSVTKLVHVFNDSNFCSQKEGATRKKKKADRDEDKPKRPKTAYFLWFMEHREEIKSEDPSMSVVDISKRAGELWKNSVTAEQKKVRWN